MLFVDDEAEFLEYMTRRLTKRGIEVDAFSEPLEALVAAEPGRFDVALLDLKMPVIGGDELLRRLKAKDPHIEVIILTGHGSIESAFETTRAGGYEYLLKPCGIEELIAAIAGARTRRADAHTSRAAKP